LFSLLRSSFLAMAISVAASLVFSQDKPQPRIVQKGLQVEVSCDPIRIRTPIARVSWEPSGKTLQTDRLDVTVYKDGFQIGVYASASSFRPELKFALSKSDKAAAFRPPGLDLLIRKAEMPSQSRRVSVTVEGLEPRLNYFWRVLSAGAGQSVSSEIVRHQAPVCPADLREDQRKGKTD